MGELSFDAQFLAGSLFTGIPAGLKGGVVFRMKKSRPTARTQAALDELLEAGLVERTPLMFGGVRYTPLQDFRRPTLAETKRAGDWFIVEDI